MSYKVGFDILLICLRVIGSFIMQTALWENVTSDTCAQKNSNQPAYPHSLIRVLSAWRNFTSLAIKHAPNEESDQIARMRRLIWIFAGRTFPKVRFFKLQLITSHYKNTPGNFMAKTWKFSDKNSDIFYYSSQNIGCGYSLEPPRRGGSNEYPRGSSNEYPQSMFLSRNKKNNV